MAWTLEERRLFEEKVSLPQAEVGVSGELTRRKASATNVIPLIQ